jgi:deazaflavin-dependent oxidoreductase (nitroreductase family)
VTETPDLNDFNAAIVEEFRANDGKVGGPFEGGALLSLHTTGANSGQPRLSPLAYLTTDGMMLIIGSFRGALEDPAWVHNLRAMPKAHIEVGTYAYDVDLRELPSDERDELYAKVVPVAPTSSDGCRGVVEVEQRAVFVDELLDRAEALSNDCRGCIADAC